MPINNTVKRTAGKIPYTIIPNFIFQTGNADAIAIYCYLLSKPDEWVIRKKDIMDSVGIGETKYKNARKILRDLGLWQATSVHGKDGRMIGQTIWISTEIPVHRMSVNHTRRCENDTQNGVHRKGRLPSTRENRPDGKRPPLVSNKVLVSKDILVSKDKPLKPDGFAEFWKAYPRKVNKAQALRSFKAQKVNGNLQEIIDDVELRCKQDDWMKENGQYIPYPSTYLNNRKWEEEKPEVNSEPF